MRSAVIGCFIFATVLIGVVNSVAARPAEVAQPTSYIRMTEEVAHDAQISPLIHLSTIGYSAKHRHAIWMVEVGTRNLSNRRIVITCRQHGDEPAGTEAAIALINHVANDPNAASHLRGVTLFIVPMVNPDGADALSRVNGVGADLNRDWGAFKQPETAAVRDAVRSVSPSFVLDVHSWDMVDPFQEVCLEGPRGAGGIGAKLLLPLANLQARAAYGLQTLARQPVAATTYGADAMGCLEHRYMLRSLGIGSMLFETAPGVNYGRSLAQRSALVYTFFNWLIDDTSSHAADWNALAAVEPKRPAALFYMDDESASSLRPVQDVGPPTEHRTLVPLICICFASLWLAVSLRFRPLPEPAEPARFRRLNISPARTLEARPNCRLRNPIDRLTKLQPSWRAFQTLLAIVRRCSRINGQPGPCN
jgi:hypothetical protein